MFFFIFLKPEAQYVKFNSSLSLILSLHFSFLDMAGPPDLTDSPVWSSFKALTVVFVTVYHVIYSPVARKKIINSRRHGIQS